MISPADRTVLDAIAWAAIDDGLQRGAWLRSLGSKSAMRLQLEGLSGTLRAAGASFVTLQRNGQLRGCIGTTRPYQALAQDVADHAFAAAFSDPRFDGLRPNERDDLRIEISVLGPSQAVPADDEQTLCDQLEVGVHGLILVADGRGATFLPSVWESLPDKRDFIAALLRKAGAPAGRWPASVQARVYRVQKWHCATTEKA